MPIRHGSLNLWYRQPAASWLEALPLGNGRLGAMVFGSVPQERIALNEGTLWSGGPSRATITDGPETVREIRRLVMEQGDYAAADRLAHKLQGPYNQSYQPLGDLWMELEHQGEIGSYERGLDLETAIAWVRYRVGETAYERRALVSHRDNALMVHLSSDGPELLDLRVGLRSLLPHQVGLLGGGLSMAGRVPAHVEPNYVRGAPDPIRYADDVGMAFACHLAVRTEEGGQVEFDGEALHISGCAYAVLALMAVTGFRGPAQQPITEPGQLAREATERMAILRERDWTLALAEHHADHSDLFNRVTLALGPTRAQIPTDERLRAVQAGAQDPGLEALYFQFGRYLLIASSRQGYRNQPANLQGLWSEEQRPAWSANWTLNINAQMNYWPAETTGLGACHGPLLSLIRELSQDGQHIARELYGCGGWTAHHNTDIWRTAWPVGAGGGDPAWSLWPMAGAWLCQHLWEHYQFGGNRAFLAEMAYPLMVEAAAFVMDWLIEDGQGHLTTCPSTSPENKFLAPGGQPAAVSVGSRMDLALAWDLLSNCIEASTLLDVNPILRERWQAARARLAPAAIGRHEQLQEWAGDWDEAELGHRHVSHLWGSIRGIRSHHDRRQSWRAPAPSAWNVASRMAVGTRAGAAPGSWPSGRAWARVNGPTSNCSPCCGAQLIPIYSMCIRPFRSTAILAARPPWPRCCCKAMKVSSSCCRRCRPPGPKAGCAACALGAIGEWI